MRTTLKRGIGRGAEVNGNGRAVLPPAPATFTRYRQPEPRRRTALQWFGRILIWLLAAALVVAAGLAGGVYLYVHKNVASVQAHSLDVIKASRYADVAPPANQAATALVVGYDHRAGPEAKLPSRSDTIMLIRADPRTDSISLLSFPRDLRVDIHCPGKQTYVDRINAAYSECGTTGTLQTIKALTNLPVNYVVTVDFRGFKQVVDRLGGVWMDVDRRYFNDNAGLVTGVSTYATINLQPGYQRLSGSDALDFVRYRHTDSDLYRVARQQEFVKAFKDQVSHTFSVTKVPSLLRAIRENLELAQAGNKKISFWTMKRYASLLMGLPSGHVFQARIENTQNAGPFGAELYAPPSAIQAAVQDFTTPDVQAPDKAAAQALGKKFRPKATGLPPQQVSISVLNGNGVPGSATNGAALLQQKGYRIVLPGIEALRNAPTYDYFRTKVYFDPKQSGSAGAARKVADLVGDADVAQLPASLVTRSNGAMLTVVLGSTFHGTLAPAPVDRTPKKEPAVVTSNPAATLPLLRSVRKRVPFRLQLPGILERNSLPDRAESIRVYQIAKGHRAVRLVFHSQADANVYWGIEETDWTDAPILQQPNFKHTIRGREYDFYYSGPHLHMIVLRDHGATYWVENSLLDELSNETMLAIAKGLRPLGR
jgi:LCP family protein required for cell wall assembly